MSRERELARHALALRAEMGRPLRLWWRDDDAVIPTAPLDRLLGIADAAEIPLTLAVIPQPWNGISTGVALAERLKNVPRLRVAVHGWSHRNHAPPDAKRQELCPTRPLEEMRAELRGGLSLLREFHGPRVLPLLVPPWNRIADALVPHLAADGFSALSTFGPERPVPGLRVVNTHLDVIDWRSGPRARDRDSLWRDLRLAAQSGQPYAGLLTHHLAHDEENWHFLSEMIDLTRDGGVEWTGIEKLAGLD
ncbi:polysaccharide deacetylase family protein [Paracoccus ravus]|uniref:polysaccharide deacetylase family protein n=1 Tax=Paracoccus ravus TaxID=2447760 RepID=UPI00106E06F7|nr:polysaccharide deacetylase family protein [Paracoccus ravus]